MTGYTGGGPSLLVFDGHDGCGKSTLAALTAAELGGQVVKPFSDSLGDHIAWLWRNERFADADRLARSSLERVREQFPPPLIFDRHWTTMFTVLPEEFWAEWGELPPTVVCHAATDTVMTRLDSRGEDLGDPQEHDYFNELYVKLAPMARNHLVLDTTSVGVEDCLAQVLDFVHRLPSGA